MTWLRTLTKRINYIDIEKKIKECVKSSGVYYEEIYITPLSGGFRVEISPMPSSEIIEGIAKCISEKASVSVKVKEYPYGKVVVATYTETREV